MAKRWSQAGTFLQLRLAHTPRRWSGLASAPTRNLQVTWLVTDKDHMSLPLWAKRFGVTNQQVADLQSQLAGHDEPLRWLLANGHIPAQEYMRWAMDEYSLPQIRDDYFSIPADPVFWDAFKTEFNWTSSFVPLAEWQGVLLIGCLELPNFHFPLHTAHRFVLAPVAALEQRYSDYERLSPRIKVASPRRREAPPLETPPRVAPPTVVASPVVASPVVPPPIVRATPQPVPAPVVQVRQRPADEVLADDLPPAPDVSLENPDGMVFEVAPASSPNLFVVPDGLAVGDIGQPLPTTPDGFEDNDESGLFEMDGTPSHPVAQTVAMVPPVYTPPAATFTAPPPAPVPVPTLAPVLAPSAIETPPVHKPVLPPGPPPRVAPIATVASISPPPVPAEVIAKANVASSEPPVSLATCSTQDALMSSTVAHISELFEHGLVLMFEDGALYARKWSDNIMSVKGDHTDPIPLELPSIFRIAYRTSLPYHGYISPNPMNTLFFNAFNRGVTPKHVTIMPVTNSGHPVAMLMGLSSAEVDYKSSLTSMEKLASDFGSQLERLRAKRAA